MGVEKIDLFRFFFGLIPNEFKSQVMDPHAMDYIVDWMKGASAPKGYYAVNGVKEKDLTLEALL